MASAVSSVPLELAHAVAGEPGAGVLLGLTTPAPGADKRLVVWERCESDGDRHTVYLRGDLVDGETLSGPAASIVLRPRAPGHYRVVDDCNGHLLHHFHVGATTGPG